MQKNDAQVCEDRAIILTVGTYEGSVLSWKAHLTNGPEPKLQSEKYFSATHHASHVRCVASSLFDSSVIVSAGADEKIHIYNGKKKIFVGESMVDGDITAMLLCDKDGKCVSSMHRYIIFSNPPSETVEYSTPIYAIASTAKGCVHVWKLNKNWQPVAVFDAHKKKCSDVAMHPSGRLAVSVGDDRMLSFIDMGNGSVAFSIKHTSKMTKCRFGSTGSSYALLDSKDQSIQIIDTETSKNQEKIETAPLFTGHKCQRRVMNFFFIDDSFIVLACESGLCAIYDTRGKKITECQLFGDGEDRSRQISACRDFTLVPLISKRSENQLLVAAISSCGRLSLGRISNQGETFAIQTVGELDQTIFRYTCVTASLCAL